MKNIEEVILVIKIMAIRKRMLEPHIWEDPDFNNLSRDTRLLFIGMISNADDYGYIRADSGSLKRLIFGFDEIKKEQVEEWRKELEKNMGNIHFYEVKGELFAHFIKWECYQKQQKDRMQVSVYPLCSKCLASAKQVPTEVKESKVKESKEKESKEKIVLATPSVADKINPLIELFKSVNPSYKRLFANTTQRICLERLIKENGQEKIEWIIKVLPKTNTMKFAPAITTPLQLESKLGSLIAFIQKEKAQLESKKIAII